MKEDIGEMIRGIMFKKSQEVASKKKCRQGDVQDQSYHINYSQKGQNQHQICAHHIICNLNPNNDASVINTRKKYFE